MVELRKNEHKTLLTIEKLSGKASVRQIMKESGLPDATIMRAALTLQDKKLVQILEKKQTIIWLNDEGKLHAKKGLPERRLVDALKNLAEKAPLKRTIEKADLDKQFIPIALGWIQEKKWAILNTKTNALQMLGKPKEGNDEKLLKLLGEKEQTTVEELIPELRPAVKLLKRRRLLETEEKTRRIINIAKAGWTAINKGIKVTAEVTQLTPELIISGKWQKVKLQKYNIKAPVAKTWPGNSKR